MLDFAQLRCFVAVGEELHFGRAARRLNMTQPPLSRQIQLLEHTMGLRLFDRTSRSVRLTPAGHSLLAEARRLLRAGEAAVADARRAALGETGTFKLGFTGGSSYALLPLLVTLAARAMPDVELALRELRTAEQMEALLAGRLDAGLIRLPVDRRGVEMVCVSRDRMILAAPQDHVLATRTRPPSLRDLDGAPLVMFSETENRFFHDLVSSLLRLAQVEPVFVQHINQIHSVLGLVSAGVGLAVVPESARLLSFRGVTLREFRPQPPTLADVHLVWRPNNENPTLRTFREFILPHLISG